LDTEVRELAGGLQDRLAGLGGWPEREAEQQLVDALGGLSEI
jgi:hypothetical protein